MTEPSFSWKAIFLPAFGPSIFFGIGYGAILPVIALTAIDLGASAALAAVIAALTGLGSLAFNLPAAVVTSRFGERRALVGASVACIVAMALCLWARHPLVLALGVLLLGMASAVYYLARQTYLIELVPLHLRARALATLGGTQRIGTFAGPFMGAGAMHFLGLAGAYWVALVVMCATAVLCWFMPELPARKEAPAGAGGDGKPAPARAPGLWQVARTYRKVFLTLGVGVLCIAAMRACRQVAIPLWGDHLQLSPSTTAVVYGLVAAIDMLVFYPAGKVMDTRGRLWVAMPCALVLGGSFFLVPLTDSLWLFLFASLLMGLGNGIGSGLVMTLGADASPKEGRTGFIGIWRLMADVGNAAGPFVLSGITAAVSLGAGVAFTGAFGLLAAVIFWRYVPRRENTGAH